MVKQIKDVLLGVKAESVATQKGKYVSWLSPLDYKPVHEPIDG